MSRSTKEGTSSPGRGGLPVCVSYRRGSATLTLCGERKVRKVCLGTSTVRIYLSSYMDEKVRVCLSLPRVVENRVPQRLLAEVER